MRHLNAKMEVMESGFRMLRPGGTFVIIDEWPALLSDRGGPLGPGFAYLFNDGLRGIDWGTFRNSIMSRIPGARFVAQTKVPIDNVHAMYLWTYRFEPERSDEARHRFPCGSGNEQAREGVVQRLMDAFDELDRFSIESIKPPEGGKAWVKFIPIYKDRVVVSKPKDADSIPKQRNCVVLSRCMHEVSNGKRLEMIRSAVDSLKPGGSLIIIDEWPHPASCTSPTKKSAMRADMDRFRRSMVFVGSIRLPLAEGHSSGMYAYQYRRVL
jgi:hypothetical protein